MNNLKFFVTGHKGFETQLFHELRDIIDPSAATLKKQYGGIAIEGELEQAYRVCLYSRLANRVFCELKTFLAANEEQLYRAVSEIDWQQHLTSRGSFSVSATLSRSSLDHSHYASLKVKDAIVDQFRERLNSRPNIEKQAPDIKVHLNIHRNQASLSLDLSGDSLHRRGYRTEHSGAPLKEHLAASMLAQAGWNKDISHEKHFIDPMCGSGTFAIEAAMIAADMAPGIDRDYFGFSGWSMHQRQVWEELLNEAESKVDLEAGAKITACDYDKNAIDIARSNAARAGVEALIDFNHQEIGDLQRLDEREALIVCNPPYGERLQAEQGLGNLYGLMGKVFRQYSNADIHIISANSGLLHRLGIPRLNKKSVKNGPIQCVIANFRINEAQTENQPDTINKFEEKSDQPDAGDEVSDGTKVKTSEALMNRLRKNAKHLQRWARKNDVSCYRMYDADLPEFSFALDVYQSAIASETEWFHLQEYQAPKTIEDSVAAERIEVAVNSIQSLFKVPEEQIFCKTRRRQRGKQQYQKQADSGELFEVKEGGASLLINLSDYLDSGLFLDHRITRQNILNMAKNKTVLNLFCYTGSFSVQAAVGQASKVTSVDMSTTYLNWAKENMTINGFDDESQFDFVRADILDLLDRPSHYAIEDKYDIIFLDPPSFSNSARMQDVLDIMRDHKRLIRQSMNLLSEDGLLLFSTNRKGFKMDEEVSQLFDVKDITAETIPEDFKRRPKFHQCFEIRQPGDES